MKRRTKAEQEIIKKMNQLLKNVTISFNYNIIGLCQ